MSAGRAKAFTKTRACPSSNDISRRRLPRGKADQITRHLASCDFCAAEQSLLCAYSQTTDEYEAAEMPEHLRRLAEALLAGKLRVLIRDRPTERYHLLQGPSFEFNFNLSARM